MPPRHSSAEGGSTATVVSNWTSRPFRRALISITAFSDTPRRAAISLGSTSLPARSRRLHSRFKLKNSFRCVNVVATLIMREFAMMY